MSFLWILFTFFAHAPKIDLYVLKMRQGQSVALVPARTKAAHPIASRSASHLTPALFVPLMISLIAGTFLPTQRQNEDHKLRMELTEGNKTPKNLQLERIGPASMVYLHPRKSHRIFGQQSALGKTAFLPLPGRQYALLVSGFSSLHSPLVLLL